MALTTLLTIASLIAAGAFGTAAIGQAGIQTGRNNAYNKIDAERARQYGIPDADYRALLDNYSRDAFNLMNPLSWGKPLTEYDYDAFQRDYLDYLNWKDEVGDLPELPNYDQILNEANSTIDAENAQINDLYDQVFNRTSTQLENALNDNSAMFSDYRNQLLSSNAIAQQGIAGSTRYELDRQQRNAITRGASAAQRLVSNINTQLGLQAQSAQQSLNTSNALAQQLLAQRQAQQGIRNDYMNAMNQNDANKANLIRGSAERKASYANSMFNQAESRYNNAMERWEDTLSAHSNNPWTDYARQNAYRTRTKTTNGL